MAPENKDKEGASVGRITPPTAQAPSHLALGGISMLRCTSFSVGVARWGVKLFNECLKGLMRVVRVLGIEAG